MRILQNPPARSLAEIPELSQPLGASAQIIRTAGGDFRIDRLRLEGGRRAGVEVVLIDTGRVRAALLPTRGMSLWRANVDGIELGWRSPVAGPIHPQWVPLSEPSGLGWLDGFDELLVRCGLQSFGSPEFDADSGRLAFPLHGRIGNLPADHLEIEVDEAHSLLHVRGRVSECRFLQFHLQLDATYTFAIGSPTIEIHDRVTNRSGQPASVQLLYHINLGTPLLAEGAKLHLATPRIVARNSHAADDVQRWSTYPAPKVDYVEQVYFSEPAADYEGWATSLLAAPGGERGFAVHYQTNTLPFFTQWKNTVGENDGYVTGLEPGTGFPNPHSFEKEKGRVLQLDGQKSVDFHLRLEGIAAAQRIEQLAGTIKRQLVNEAETVAFDPDWCVPRE